MTISGQPPGVADLAEQVAAAVSACPGVARLAAGPLATYLPGRTVPGVAIRGEQIELAIVARFGPPLPEVDSHVREAVDRIAPGRPVTVRFEDIELPDDLARPREPRTASVRAAPDSAGARA